MTWYSFELLVKKLARLSCWHVDVELTSILFGRSINILIKFRTICGYKQVETLRQQVSTLESEKEALQWQMRQFCEKTKAQIADVFKRLPPRPPTP